MENVSPMQRVKKRIVILKFRINAIIINFLDHVFRGGIVSLTLTSLIWASIFLYILFYNNYIPTYAHVRPIHFQLKPCTEGIKETCPFPSAHVRLTRKHQLLTLGQSYRFQVQLEMPESPVNKKLGMFMVCLQLRDKTGFLTSHACRSNMLHYRSEVVNMVMLLILSPLYIFFGREEKQILNFEIYSDFEDDQNHPTTDIYVEVQSREVEIYSATVLINARLSGLRYFMYYWPATSALLGITLNFTFMLFALLFSLYRQYLLYLVPPKPTESIVAESGNEEVKEIENKDGKTIKDVGDEMPIEKKGKNIEPSEQTLRKNDKTECIKEDIMEHPPSYEELEDIGIIEEKSSPHKLKKEDLESGLE